MITGRIDELNELEIFNTPYKIKLKGIIKSIGSIDTFILETHGKIYALTPSVEKFILNEELSSPKDFEEEFFVDALLFFNYNKELIIESSETFKSNIFSVQTVEKMLYDKRTLIAKSVLSEELTLNPDVKKELNENKKLYQVDKFTFVKNLYRIKNETLDDIIDSKKILTEMMEEINKFEYRKDLSNPMSNYTKITNKMVSLVNNLENILNKNINKDDGTR